MKKYDSCENMKQLPVKINLFADWKAEERSCGEKK